MIVEAVGGDTLEPALDLIVVEVFEELIEKLVSEIGDEHVPELGIDVAPIEAPLVLDMIVTVRPRHRPCRGSTPRGR